MGKIMAIIIIAGCTAALLACAPTNSNRAETQRPQASSPLANPSDGGGNGGGGGGY